MREPAVRVPDAEMDVLVVLRRSGPLTTGEVVRALERARPMSHGSAGTLLGRLHTKGMVQRRKGDVGKAYVYSATRRGESALRGSLQRLVARVFGGDRMMVVASLLESQPLEPGEIARLERLFADLAPKPAPHRAPGSRR